MIAVLAHELAGRGRGRLLAGVAVAWLVALGAVAVGVELHQAPSGSLLHAAALTDAPAVGKAVFQWVTAAMCVLLMMGAPVVAAHRLGAARDQGALAAAQVTQLRPAAIIAGYVFAGVAQVVLLVAVGVPVLVWGCVLGGATAGEVATAAGAVAAVGLVGVVVGTSFAAAIGNRMLAGVTAASVALVLLAGTLGGFAAGGGAFSGPSLAVSSPPRAVLVANPLVAVADAVGTGSGRPFEVAAPLDALRGLVRPAGARPAPLLPWWAWSAALGALLCLLCWLAALRGLTLPARRPPFGWRRRGPPPPSGPEAPRMSERSISDRGDPPAATAPSMPPETPGP